MICNYCNFEQNGDIPEDREDLFNKDFYPQRIVDVVDDNRTVDIHIKVEVCCRESLQICKDGLYWSMECDDQIKEEVIKINYCPMCGRKLNV